ncbi:MAG: hypothetical protein JNK12_14085 [Acidimicrobiales bacterium]|nr:hypothetical protein [Acidimicrobiales bacterium]
MQPASQEQPEEADTTTENRGPRAVPGAWLAEFSDSEATRRLAELEADKRLVERAMWANYQGRDWDKIAERLVGYGVRVIGAWISTGVIFERCQAKGFRLERFDRRQRQLDADYLAKETVTIALRHFRDSVLIPGRWDPGRGASLSTFFIGQCLVRFPNVWRRWLPEAKRLHDDAALRLDQDVAELSDELVRSSYLSQSPEATVLLRLHAREMLNSLDPTTSAVVFCRAQNYSWQEIATLTGLSVSAAKSRWHRLQREEHR